MTAQKVPTVQTSVIWLYKGTRTEYILSALAGMHSMYTVHEFPVAAGTKDWDTI